MKLSTLLPAHGIVLGVRARTLREAVSEILNRAEGFRPSEPLPVIVEAVLRREAQASTTLEHGVAVPHARIRGLRDFHILLGRAETPLEDKGTDGQPVDLVFVILANDQKNTLMLQSLAAVSILGGNPEWLDRMRQASSHDAVWQVIDESGVEVKKGLYARDLMRDAPVIAREDMTLRELLDLMFEHQVYQAPVCSSSGHIIGAVTAKEIIDAGFPDYMSRIRDIGFLSQYEPFEQFFKRETAIRVGEIMDRRPLIVEADDPLIQVVFPMKQTGHRLAYVQEGGRFVGLIVRDDLLSRILRA